jgi:serine/threonine protein kinase
MIETLLKLAEHQTLHRGVKLENFLCEKFNVENNELDIKLGDFGLAKTFHQTMTATQGVGTFKYMAPEVRRGEKQSHSVDIWSVGVILYYLLANEFETHVLDLVIFEGRENFFVKLRENISKISPKRHEELIFVMERMIDLDQETRIRIEELREWMESGFSSRMDYTS